jgi:hypothetical protein
MSETLASVMKYAVDLGKTIKKTYMDTLFATDDREAHRFDIILYRDNAKLTIPSGASVSAYFIRYSDNVTIPLKGSVDGNVVSVTLKESCYKKAGQFALIIKAKNVSEEKAVFYGEGAIFTSSTDSILDDEHIIPSLSDLLAQIDAMEAATAAANTATGNANTATANANEAAGKANTAADTANTAANNANVAAGNANTSADTANEAAGKIDSMTVTATTLETGSPATAALETVDGHYQLNLGLPKGNTGNTGATPQISVQVATGAAGSDASVSVSGTAEEPVIHLTIPRGDTGAIENMTINGKPVESGTITLTPEDLGAATAESVSQLKDDMAAGLAEKLGKTETAADSSKLGGKAPEYYLQPRNLLDNSDFRNPVNQRGYTLYNTLDYTIDRWILYFPDWANFTLENGLVFNASSTGCSFYQRIDAKSVTVGAKYTLAYMLDGDVHAQEKIFEATENEFYDVPVLILEGKHTLLWAALYEGSYTAETLPPYVPKGYAAELAECQRYYLKNVGNGATVAFISTNNQVSISIPTPVKMRATPTATALNSGSIVSEDWTGPINGVTNVELYNNSIRIFCKTLSSAGNWATGILYDLIFELSADL